jgi:hypothetical protein
MNIELTSIEAEVLATLLEAEMGKMGFNFEQCKLLSGIKKKILCIPIDNHEEDDHNVSEESDCYTGSQRWGK